MCVRCTQIYENLVKFTFFLSVIMGRCGVAINSLYQSIDCSRVAQCIQSAGSDFHSADESDRKPFSQIERLFLNFVEIENTHRIYCFDCRRCRGRHHSFGFSFVACFETRNYHRRQLNSEPQPI